MEAFADYGHAILALALYGAIVLVLNALTGIRKGAKNMCPGQDYAADYDDPSYRLDRAYMNTLESLVYFTAITGAAILAGASPFWVNLLASGVLVIRIAYIVAYLKKWGAGYGGLRTVLSVIAAVMLLAMLIMVVGRVV